MSTQIMNPSSTTTTSAPLSTHTAYTCSILTSAIPLKPISIHKDCKFNLPLSNKNLSAEREAKEKKAANAQKFIAYTTYILITFTFESIRDGIQSSAINHPANGPIRRTCGLTAWTIKEIHIYIIVVWRLILTHNDRIKMTIER